MSQINKKIFEQLKFFHLLKIQTPMFHGGILHCVSLSHVMTQANCLDILLLFEVWKCNQHCYCLSRFLLLHELDQFAVYLSV